MSQINCLRCKKEIDSAVDVCPLCGERVTNFQRTYSTRLIDGKYQILERLGLGGMGEIFKVRHIHLNEQRVIKIMRANIASDDQSLQRFLQEARTSTMIKHRNLAMLYDFSTLDDGSYYMVWEFIEGTNIQKWIGQNGAMPQRLALEIAIQTLQGLEHLHQMGLIHRDISPENIMLSQDRQGKLLVKVIDFGIAKQLGEGGESGGQGLTQTGMFLGKLKYASPEQAGFLKEGEHLDARSDLYSFSNVFYEMLAGRAPFLSTNPHGYILKHATEKAQPIAQLNPNVKVHQQLEAVLFRSLEKNRDDRHVTAAHYVEELEPLRNEIPPDEKYGLGDRKQTLSAAPTLSGARPTRTGSATTSATGTLTPSPTVSGRATPPVKPLDSQTVVERTGPTPPPSAEGQATMVEARPQTDPQATMVDRVSTTGTGGATVVEDLRPSRTVSDLAHPAPRPEPKKRMGLYGAIAAVVLMAVGGAIYFGTRPDLDDVVKPKDLTIGDLNRKKLEALGLLKRTPTHDEMTISSTAPPSGVSEGDGLILLTASPYGRLEKILNVETRRSFDLAAGEDAETPLRLTLPAGKYEITLSNPQSKASKTLEVQVEAKRSTSAHVKLQAIDTKALTEEIFRQ